MVHHGAALRKLRPDWADIYVWLAKDDWTAFSSKERNLLRVARKLTQHPPHLEDEDIERLRRDGWGDREITQVVLIVAYFNFVNRVMLGLDVELEEEYREAFPERKGRRDGEPV